MGQMPRRKTEILRTNKIQQYLFKEFQTFAKYDYCIVVLLIPFILIL